MQFPFQSLPALLAAVSFAAFSQEMILKPVDVTASKINDSSKSELGASNLDKSEIAPKRASTSDTAQLLEDIPGVSIVAGGGISGIPVIHGMADERLNVQVNGMGLMPACPNHMNTPLSYIDPTSVDSIKVYAGVTPVSVGGDSIGGSILVNSAQPKFAKAGEGLLLEGALGGLYRSNNKAQGGNIHATIASENLNLTYSRSTIDSENYRAAKPFHKAGPATVGARWLDGDEVGSSAFEATNQDVGIALRYKTHLIQFNASEQDVPYEGFPNQRMDLTKNESTIYNLAYKGNFEWGDLEARAYRQNIHHTMDMGPDRIFGDFVDRYTGVHHHMSIMPMVSRGKVLGTKLQANMLPSDTDTVRVGLETQYYTLYDSWPANEGGMGPNSFWNIDYGTRDKVSLFGEWESAWSPEWTGLLGVRADHVISDAGPVRGYNGDLKWTTDADAFNARDHKRVFKSLDLTMLLRYEPDAKRSFDLGYARKSRAPSLYQLYPWSTDEMAMTMNNFSGDGGGYVGNLDLKQEVAHTLSTSGDWHDAARQEWNLRATAYYTHIENYISAERCRLTNCPDIFNPDFLTATGKFVALQYVNQTAEIYGLDLSGSLYLGRIEGFGNYTVKGLLNYLRGKETSTGDKLFNMMPLNAKVALIHRQGDWTNTVEVQMVAAKRHVSQIRNEVEAEAYTLLNLRSSIQLGRYARLDLAIENATNRFYQHPLGGAYVGQGRTMYLDSIQYGNYVPGMGRSYNAALNLQF
jgi:iron complex outermembrane receptor protein